MEFADDAIADYLDGELIDPCKYDQFALEKLDEFLGGDAED